MGLFYAWDGTLRHEKGTTQVNLLLNRASPWMDIDSYLPYEGKVVLKNKKSREVFVRMPLWADRKAVRCSIGQQEVPNLWLNNRLRFRSLQPNDAVTIRFPIEVKTEEWKIPGLLRSQPSVQVHTCKFKGNTLAEISPPLVSRFRTGYYLGEAPMEKEIRSVDPPYQRSYFLKNQAPMKKVTRFVTPLILKW
jgi:hypothetical protein